MPEHEGKTETETTYACVAGTAGPALLVAKCGRPGLGPLRPVSTSRCWI